MLYPQKRTSKKQQKNIERKFRLKRLSICRRSRYLPVDQINSVRKTYVLM